MPPGKLNQGESQPDLARQAFLDTERSKWLSIEEASYLLRTSRRVITRMLQAGTVPYRRDGKVIRIHVDDLRPARMPTAREDQNESDSTFNFRKEGR